MSENTAPNAAMNWDDTIQNDSSEFILLEEGTYPFVIDHYERSFFKGSEKVSQSPMAIVHLKVTSPEGDVTFKHNLILNRKTEGLICEFFRSIGLRKHGEPLKMEWNKIAGRKGFCKVIVKELDSTKKPGEKFKVNNVKKFLDPDEVTKEADNESF